MKKPLHLYRDAVRTCLNFKAPFLRSKLLFNVRDIALLYKNENDPLIIKDVLERSELDLQFLKELNKLPQADFDQLFRNFKAQDH